MTPEQMNRATALNKKIEATQKHIDGLKKMDQLVTAESWTPAVVNIRYSKEGNNKDYVFNPLWIEDEVIRKDALNAIDECKDKMVSMLEAYKGSMLKEFDSL